MSFLRSVRAQISQASSAWKITVYFMIATAALMLIGAVLTLFGLHEAASRVFAYMALTIVGFLVSWGCLAYLSIRHASKRKGRG